MKYFSLFSGIGGFELGIMQAHENNRKLLQKKTSESIPKNKPNASSGQERLTCVGYSEIDKYAAQIYKKNFPEHKNYGDIKKIKAEELPDFDILVGGFPCQSFSIAGKRKGFLDTRGTLFFDIARIVQEKQPRLLLLENVKGLLSHDEGRTFATIIGALDELGYDLQWQVLNSKDFGVPQNRERVFIVGHIRGTSRPEVFPLTSDYGSNTRQPTSNAITASYFKGIDNHGQRTHIGTLRTHKDGQGFREVKSGLSPTIPARAREDGSGQPVVFDLKSLSSKTRRGIMKKGYTGTLDHDCAQVISCVRRLTPLECERLQGFPDLWTSGVSDTQRYKCLGNGVTVNVVQAIISKII